MHSYIFSCLAINELHISSHPAFIQKTRCLSYRWADLSNQFDHHLAFSLLECFQGIVPRQRFPLQPLRQMVADDFEGMEVSLLKKRHKQTPFAS